MKGWIWGAIIAVLVALNIFQASMLIGQHLVKNPTPYAIAMKKVKQFPADERHPIYAAAKALRPQLHASQLATKQARQDLATYLTSPNYNRAEAQRRFDDLRIKTNTTQTLGAQMVLDVADKLTPEERAKILNGGD